MHKASSHLYQTGFTSGMTKSSLTGCHVRIDRLARNRVDPIRVVAVADRSHNAGREVGANGDFRCPGWTGMIFRISLAPRHNAVVTRIHEFGCCGN